MKFLGYPDNSAGYRTYDPHTHKVQVACAPVFREMAHSTLLSSFESAGNDSNAEGDPSEAPQYPDPVPIPLADSDPMPPPSTLVHPAPLLAPPSPLVTLYGRDVLCVVLTPQTSAHMVTTRKQLPMLKIGRASCRERV